VGKGFAVGGTFLEDGFPRQPGLGALKEEEFKQTPIIIGADAPFGVVILYVEVMARLGPGAAFFW
jgi:hypothetical protein